MTPTDADAAAMGHKAFARAVATAFAVALALLGCAGVYGERVREQVHQSVAAGTAPAVQIENVVGSVRVEGWPKPIVDVQATKFGYDAEELRGVTVEVSRDAGGVSIVTHYPESAHKGGVNYRISVPEGASLRITNEAGTVELAGVKGDLDVETQTGEITADAGRVDANRSIVLRATTGAIRLTIASGSNAKVDAASTVGDFSSAIAGITRTRQNLVGAQGGGTIGNGSGRIRLETTTGAIALKER